MDELNALLQDIEKLRNNLHKLINDKTANLQDPEVLSASKTLNIAVSKYLQLLSDFTDS